MATNSMNLSAVADEPLDRLEERALGGVDFGIKALRRLRRRLPAWLRPDGQPDPARCIAAVALIDTVLSTISPKNMQQMAKRIRKQLEESGLDQRRTEP